MTKPRLVFWRNVVICVFVPVDVSPAQSACLCLAQAGESDELHEVSAVCRLGVVDLRTDGRDDGDELLEAGRLADGFLRLLDLQSGSGRVGQQMVRHREVERAPDEEQSQVVSGRHAEVVAGQPGGDVGGDNLRDRNDCPTRPVAFYPPCNGFQILRKSLEPRGIEPLTSSMPLRRSTN
jgi:hypothetical protein